MPRTRRSFPPEFKAQIVLELLTGSASQAELCRKYNVKPQLLAYWKAAVIEHLPAVFEADGQLDLERQRIADLEQLVGRQALELEILKKASRLLSGPARRNGGSS
jgi:transposase